MSKKDIDKICKKYDITNYTINKNGSIDVNGDVNLSSKKLRVLPLRFGTVTGNFCCDQNKLTSLKGCPEVVGGMFFCYDNKLTSLKYCPKELPNDFDCSDNDYNVKVFFTYGRTSKQLELHQSHMGRTSALDLQRYFMTYKFNDITVYTDSHRSYGKFFKTSPYEHKIFRGKQHVGLLDRNIHNQTVNAYTRDFKNFVNRTLKGVSTKYLNNYVKWYQFINEVKNIVRKKLNENVVKFDVVDEICSEVVSDKKGLELFRQTEYSFVKFLEQNYRTNYGDCNNHYYNM